MLARRPMRRGCPAPQPTGAGWLRMQALALPCPASSKPQLFRQALRAATATIAITTLGQPGGRLPSPPCSAATTSGNRPTHLPSPPDPLACVPGLAHIFILAANEGNCTALPAAYAHVSCAWATRPGADGPGTNPVHVLWAKQW